MIIELLSNSVDHSVLIPLHTYVHLELVDVQETLSLLKVYSATYFIFEAGYKHRTCSG